MLRYTENVRLPTCETRVTFVTHATNTQQSYRMNVIRDVTLIILNHILTYIYICTYICTYEYTYVYSNMLYNVYWISYMMVGHLNDIGEVRYSRQF